ncbi:hypothetical protein ACGFOM_30890 [Streptomyces sp. NPDC048594]|uniref:hypothetical protein n=1 Tax=Streptomyces sp. NPDC048594 TaxID=3365575 RepID=UPI003714B29F
MAQVFWAARARVYASSTSAGVETGRSASGRPVYGALVVTRSALAAAETRAVSRVSRVGVSDAGRAGARAVVGRGR